MGAHGRYVCPQRPYVGMYVRKLRPQDSAKAFQVKIGHHSCPTAATDSLRTGKLTGNAPETSLDPDLFGRFWAPVAKRIQELAADSLFLRK
jgi:hypothetical protein